MIIGDGIVLGAGGEKASIFVTGLSQTDTVTATKDGKTVKGKWLTESESGRFTAGHPECIISTADYLLYSHSGRNYKKAYSGDAYACTVRINSGWLYPLLVSKNKDSVAFYTDGNYSSGIMGYELTVTYLGETWYVSSGGAAYQATSPDSSNVVHLNTLLGKTWDTREEAALAFLEYASPQPVDGFEISPIKEYGMWTVTATNGYETSINSVYIDVATEFNVEINYEPNYTFLYYYGDECADITGGWAKNPKGTATDSNSDYVYSGSPIVTSTVNNNSDSGYIEAYIQVNSNTSASIPYRGALSLGTVNTVDLSEYTGILYKHSTTSKYGSVSLQIPISETILGNEGNYSAVTVSGIKVNVGVTLDSTNRPYFRLSAVRNNSNYSSLKLYAFCLLKPDPWDILASIANIQAVSISDILNKSDVLLSSNEAVLYMINCCTGDFMASAISSQTFMTVLESSPYKDLVYANKHWSKFLSMVQ